MAETPAELQAEVEKLERKQAENPEGRYFVPLANAYRKLGRLESAESLLRDGLRLHPEYLSAHIVLGRCLADRGAAGEAAEEFRYVLSLDPQNLIALRSLGEISLGAGRPDEAERWFRELLAADPMNDEARRALTSLQASAVTAPAEEAGAEAEEPPLLEDEEESPELVTETIAELYARQGLHDRAADVYRELIRRRGGDAALERRLAEVERLAAGVAPALEAEPEPRPEPEPELPETGWEEAFEPRAAEPESAEEEDFFAAFGYELEPEPAAAEPDAEPYPPEPAPAPEPEEPEEPVPAAPAAARQPGPTISSFLAELAAWRPGAAEALSPDGTGSAADETSPWGLPALAEEPEAAAEAPRGEEPAEAAPRAAATPTPTAEAEDDDDLESFQAWLRSLKR